MAPTVCLFPCACACACALSLLGLGSLHGASPDDEATRDHGRGAPPLLRWAHAPRRMCLPDQEIRSPTRVSPVPLTKTPRPTDKYAQSSHPARAQNAGALQRLEADRARSAVLSHLCSAHDAAPHDAARYAAGSSAWQPAAHHPP
jgi:hypothetical protein